MKIKTIEERNKHILKYLFKVENLENRSKLFKCFKNIDSYISGKFKGSLEFDIRSINLLYYKDLIDFEIFNILKHILFFDKDLKNIQNYLLYSPKTEKDFITLYKKLKDTKLFEFLGMSIFNFQTPNPYPKGSEYLINFENFDLEYFRNNHKDIYKNFEGLKLYYYALNT